MKFADDFPEHVQQLADSYFRNDYLNCAESVMKALLVAGGYPCPLDVLRTASAFGRGMGGAGCSCGCLVGAQIVAGMFFGRTAQTGPCPSYTLDVAKTLHDAFVTLHRATCCRVLHKGLPYGTPEQFAACAVRTVQSARMAAEVLQQMAQKFPVSYAV